MESLRSRNVSEKADEEASFSEGKEIIIKLKRANESLNSEEKAKLKVKSKPLVRNQGLQIFITREDDPAFFYSVDITEEDYRELRLRQGLLVDLAAFPAMLFRLLDTCLLEQNAENPKFFPSLEFHENDHVVFEVQEINMFRRLAHLSLKLKRGNDAKVREHLGECLKQLKLEHAETVKRLHEKEGALKEIEADKANVLSEFDRLKREFGQRDALLQTKLAQDLSEERERAAKAVAEMRMSYENERRRLVEDNAGTLRTLENRVAALDYDNRDLTEKKHKNEALMQRLKEEQKHLQEECQKLRTDVDKYKLEKETLGQGNHELDRNLHKLRSQLEVVEGEKIRLLEDLHKRDEAIQDLLNQRKHLEQELSEKKNLVTKRENAVKNVSQELLKANEVIKKLQDQNRKENHKIKLGCQIVQEQEKVLTDKETELENTRKQLKDKTEELSQCQTDMKSLELRLDELRTDNEDLAKKVRTNETVIQWLNKQLTTAQARDPGLRLGPPPEGINFTASAMASTSTPLTSRPAAAMKENKKPISNGLDPKYFQPSPTLRPAQSNLSAASNKSLGNNGGLLRRNLHKDTSNPQPAPQSVYFAKT